ncbi:alpha/beta fold hydrolase [Streptomyces sp. NBC_00467]|uniref:alpha/beta fold hydrolase n=1 Tax=Streptomyces sp. NBC_00467 TaxID=2975752 RepID=UPI002E177783
MADLLAISGDGVPVTALDEGEGPILLVVHPGGGPAISWNGVTAHLADSFRVVRVNRRIYVSPRSTPRLQHSLRTETADVLAIAGLLGGPLVLVGHSSGAVVALETALRSPALFAGVIAYEPPMPTRSPAAGEAGHRARAALDASDPAEAMRIHLRDIAGMPAESVDAMLAYGPTRDALAAYASAQITDNEAIDALGVGIDRYRHLSLPTTLIQGDRSPAQLHERVSDLAVTLPNAHVITLQGQGHTAHQDAPEVLAGVISEAAGAVSR